MDIGSNFKKEEWAVAKMAEWEVPEFTSSHRHTKTATTYRASIHENDFVFCLTPLHDFEYSFVKQTAVIAAKPSGNTMPTEVQDNVVIGFRLCKDRFHPATDILNGGLAVGKSGYCSFPVFQEDALDGPRIVGTHL